jgi:hypothetical protein
MVHTCIRDDNRLVRRQVYSDTGTHLTTHILQSVTSRVSNAYTDALLSPNAARRRIRLQRQKARREEQKHPQPSPVHKQSGGIEKNIV